MIFGLRKRGRLGTEVSGGAQGQAPVRGQKLTKTEYLSHHYDVAIAKIVKRQKLEPHFPHFFVCTPHSGWSPRLKCTVPTYIVLTASKLTFVSRTV